MYNQGQAGANIQTLAVSNNITLIPTIVFRRSSDGMLFFAGEAMGMVDQGVEGELKENFKLGLVSNNEEERKEAEELTRQFFSYLYTKYAEQDQAGYWGSCDKTKVYVSYPAKWPSFIRLTMINCAVAAGFGTTDNVFGLDEPTAAVLACLHENEEKLKSMQLFFENQHYKAMMVDMGAGTTDIVLFNYTIEKGQLHLSELVTYPTADSSKLCGGREIDQCIGQYCEDYVHKIPAGGNSVPPTLLSKCRTEAKRWKEQTVSPMLRDNETVGMPSYMSTTIDMMKTFGIPMNSVAPLCINRLTFEALTQKHWADWRSLISEALEDGKNHGYPSADDFDVVILTGGHSQWYGVKEFFLGHAFAGLAPVPFAKIQQQPERLLQSTMPQFTVATGLCLKDEAIVAAVPMANSLWVQFEYEGKKSEVIEVISKGVRLPFEQKLDTITDTIKGNFIYRREFFITCTVYEGSTLETAKHESVTARSADDGFISVIFKAAVAALLSPFMLLEIIVDWVNGKLDWSKYKDVLDADYSICLTPTVSITEDGIATVSTYITVDDNVVNMTDIKI